MREALRDAYIVDPPLRSPIASVKIGGPGLSMDEPLNTSSISDLPPEEVLRQVLEQFFKKTGILKDAVEYVILGSAIVANTEPSLFQAPAKYVSRYAGCTGSIGRAVEEACSTGLYAIWYGARDIMLGDADLVIACGVDMMSRQPNRVILNGLTDPSTGKLMVILADQVAVEKGFTKEEHDMFAFGSYEKAKAHLEDHGESIVPITIRPGEQPVLTFDEEVTRVEKKKKKEPLTLERFTKLRPYPDCKIMTMLNSSKYGDGCGVVGLASSVAIKRYSLKPRSRLLSYAAVSGYAPKDFILMPQEAIIQAVERAGLTLDTIDFFMVNEAFPTSCLNIMRSPMSIPSEKINPWGGVTASGHPIGGTGLMLTAIAHVIAEKERKKYFVVCHCNAIAEAVAVVFERVDEVAS